MDNNLSYMVKRYSVSPNYISEQREVFETREYGKPINYKNNSRYSNLRTLYDEKRKVTVHENWNPVYLKRTNNDTFYTVTLESKNRLDLIANTYYDSPRYWWVIALANHLIDPFDVPIGTVLRIPPISIINGGSLNG